MFRITTKLGEFLYQGNDRLKLELNGTQTPIQKDLKNLENYLNRIQTSNNYKEFIEFLRKEASYRINSFYYFFLNEDEFYIFRGGHFEIELLFRYKPEYPGLLEYLKKILVLSDTKKYTIVSTNSRNRYSIIAPWQVVDVLLTKEYIKCIGEESFHSFRLKSKNGKIRDIVAPHEKIKASLRELNALLQKVYDRRNAKVQVAYKKGKSVVSGAKPHKQDKYVFNLDIHDFYPSCKKELVKHYVDFLFSYSMNRAFIEEDFLDTITIDGGLFIGSPISGTLANAIISNPVSFMNNICEKYGMTVTVYADDISFSSSKRISKKFAEGIFTAAFEKYGLAQYFKINEKKSIGFSGCHRKITGVSINENNVLTVPTRYFRQLRTEIEHLANSKSNVNIEKLRGKIAYATMLDESGKVYRYLKKFSETVKAYSLCSEEKLKAMEERFGGTNGAEC